MPLLLFVLYPLCASQNLVRPSRSVLFREIFYSLARASGFFLEWYRIEYRYSTVQYIRTVGTSCAASPVATIHTASGLHYDSFSLSSEADSGTEAYQEILVTSWVQHEPFELYGAAQLSFTRSVTLAVSPLLLLLGKCCCYFVSRERYNSDLDCAVGTS